VRTTILYILVILCFQATAQTNKKDRKRTTEYKGQSIELPRLDLTHLRSTTKEKTGAHQFAERRDVELTPSNSGSWNKKDTYWEWSLDIRSPGAISMNLGFTEYQLPESSTLVIYNAEGRKLGPFTKSDNKEHLQLWTPILSGEIVTLKLQVPEESMEDVKLKLTAVNHGFAQPELRSGSCNIDVACGDNGTFPIINRYEDQIRSVAVMQIDGLLSCSGFLINSTQNDFQPYFLTAAHCGVTARNAASTVVYWNYENASCRPVESAASGNFGDGMLTQFNQGATVVSSTPNLIVDVDFTLLLLDEPVDPDFGPYFVGWDIRPILPDSTFVIHHPNAEEKRISFDFDRPQFDLVNSDSIFLRVLNYELGTTEPGSSGAPLFNQTGRAVGHVSGGIASCFERTGFDQYGWIGMAWDNGNSSQTRLRDWLDPTNSGTQFMDGLDGSFTIKINSAFEKLCGLQNPTLQREITVDTNFEGTVQLSVDSFPSELNPSLERTQLSPGESTILTLENLDALLPGVYEISLLATDGNNENVNDFTIEIVENVPNILIPQMPLSDQVLGGSLATFMWEGDADEYEIQISENIEFVDPIIEEKISSNLQFSTNGLNESSEYFWRVRASNLCGQSVYSEPIKFRTSSLICTETTQADLGLIISQDGIDTITAEIRIDLTSPIESVTIPVIAGTHTWSSDLTFSLISPSGTVVSLSENLCSNMQFMNFDIGFSDAGFPISNLPCPFIDGRIYQPESALSIFNGENPSGVWTLRLVDEFNLDGGFLESFHLEICTASGGQLFTEFAESTFNACGTNQIESSLQLSANFDSNVAISTVSTNENLTVSFDKTEASPGETINYSINNIDVLEDMTSSVRFLFTSGVQTSESVVVLNFQSVLPDFDLLIPENNSFMGIGDNLTFDWEDVPGATGYIIELGYDDPTFSDSFSTELSSDESAFNVILDFFEPNEKPDVVYWRVTAIGEDCDRISPTSLFIVDITDAVNELGDLTITILPNPFESDILIDFSASTNADFVIDLFSSSGSRLKTHSIKSGSTQFNVNTSDVPPGIYFLRMQSMQGVIVEKIVKQR